jgi:hypothetical protein
MKYLFLLLFIGCVSSPTAPKVQSVGHNLAGSWWVNGDIGEPWIISQNGNDFFGRQSLTVYANKDSCIEMGTITGDSVLISRYSYSHGSFFTEVIQAAVQKNDSLLQGIFYDQGNPNSNNPFYSVRVH